MKPVARSPVYDPPLINVSHETDVERLEREVRAFPHPNKDVEGFFAERGDHRTGRYEDWAKKDEKLRRERPDLYDQRGNLKHDGE